MLAGTSMASPHAAGAATLLRNAFPGATGAQVVQCMVSSADKTVTPNPSVNGKINPAGGVLNVQAAYACLRALFPYNPPSPPTPSPPTPSPPTPSPPSQSPISCGDCSANGLCSEEDGCMCVPFQAGEACSCNTTAGFEEFSIKRDSGDGQDSNCGYGHWIMGIMST
jgi:Subtilase family